MNYLPKPIPSVPLIYSDQCDRKAIRVRFFRNGDKYYGGFSFPISFSRYRNFNTLLKDLNTSVFCDQTRLPVGVRYIFGLDGEKIKSISDMTDGGNYVCSSYNQFISMNYLCDTFDPVWKTSTKKVDAQSTVRSLVVRDNHPIRSYSYLTNVSVQRSSRNFSKNINRTLVVIKNGPSRPRQIYRWTLKLRPLPSFAVLMEELSELLDRKISHLYTTEGKEIFGLPDILKTDSAFIAFPEETIDQTDFMISNQELTLINILKKAKIKDMSNIQVSISGDKAGWKKLNDAYDVGQKLGSGNFSTVRECKNRKNNALGCLKRIDLHKCGKDINKIHKEIEILSQLDHPNIIKLLDQFETCDYLYLVLELMLEGDVIDTIFKSRYYSEHDVSGMLHNLVSGLFHIHSLNIVHRDIKMDNLLVHKNPDGSKKLKICDFGMATKASSRKPLFTVCGTPDYMAPEVISQEGYNTKVDIWAAGVFLYILLNGIPPFQSNDGDFNTTFENIINGKYDLSSTTWEVISREAKELIPLLLEPDPNKRLIAEEILNNPWVSGEMITSNINLKETIGNRLIKLVRCNKANVLASTALDKESNYFEKAADEQPPVSKTRSAAYDKFKSWIPEKSFQPNLE